MSPSLLSSVHFKNSIIYYDAFVRIPAADIMHITHQCVTPFKNNVYFLAGSGELMYGLEYESLKGKL